MDWNRVEGNWKQIKGKVKQQWGKLTDDDLDVIAGKQDQLEGMIQQRYGHQKKKGSQRLVRSPAMVSFRNKKAPSNRGFSLPPICAVPLDSPH